MEPNSPRIEEIGRTSRRSYASVIVFSALLLLTVVAEIFEVLKGRGSINFLEILYLPIILILVYLIFTKYSGKRLKLFARKYIVKDVDSK